MILRLSRAPWLLASLAAFALAGCGDDSDETGGGGSDTGSGGGTPASSSVASTATSSTGGPTSGMLGTASAPTRDTVVATYTGAAPPSDAPSYVITSERGPLVVTTVTIDEGAHTVTLATEPQKLGVEYEMAIASPGGFYDGQGNEFLAADTVVLWATDLDSPSFPDYQLTARRVAVGEHAVLYLEEGQNAQDIEETLAAFDDTIYPTETEAFREPPDRDDNGKILLLGLDGGNGYAGYFNPTNTLSEEEAESFGVNTNAMEMIYFNVTIEPYFGYDPYGVVPHEYLHLLYAEEHGAFSRWDYHNEGLAECAVTRVWGANDIAAYVYADDYYEDLRVGKSLVQWEYSNYSQYAQAYVFWTYAAGQLGGMDGYSTLFHTEGDPGSIDLLFQNELGKTFGEVQLGFMTAAWAQEGSGEASFEGLLTLPERPQPVPAGMSDLELAPYGGVFFEAPGDAISPDGAGEDIVHRGLDGESAIDDEDPFDAESALLALNTRLADVDDLDTENTGTVARPQVPFAGHGPRRPMPEALQKRLRRFAPPVAPSHPAMRAFREALSRP